MMEKRLKLAKKLLNPKDSVLIVTIDEKEYLHLGCLLEEMFPEAKIQMVSAAINGKGVAQNDYDLDNPEHVNQLNLAKEEFLKLHPKAWFEEGKLTKTQNRVKLIGFYRIAETLNVVIDGFRYDFGVGGIHGSVQGTVHAKKGWRIIDLDVR